MTLRAAGWSKEHRIRWVEQRLLERRAKEKGRIEDDLDAMGIPDSTSLEVWLAKERDGLSWQQIVIKYYPQYRKSTIKTAGISKARRAYMSVENSPDRKKSFKHGMDETIQDLFGCSPQDFKRYIDSIRYKRRK